MSREFVFLLLGLGLGGAYAVMTLGVVAVYRASGVPNFAQGAIAMIFSFVFFNLRGDIGSAAAVVVTLLLAALLGVLFYVLVMRQLRSSPLMAKVAATIALLLLLHGLAFVLFPITSTTPTSILPQNRIHISGFGIPLDRFLVAAIAVACAIALEVVARRTKFGLATRAIADSEKGVILIGRSPGLLAAANWAIACVLAALAGILLTPIAGLDADALTLLIVPVFAAALLARFTSYVWAVAAGLGLGMAQSLLQLYSAPGPWYTTLWEGPGRADAFPALVVFAAMLLTGRMIPQRDFILRGRLPASPEPRHLRIGLSLLLIVGVILYFVLPLNWVAALTATVVATIIGTSLVLLTGMGGQISLLQFGFAGLGAFVAAKAAASGIPLIPGLLLAALAGASVGLVVGIPALRVRGQALAIMTLAFSLALYDFVFTNGELMGPLGFLQIGGYPIIAGWRLDARSYGIMCLAILTASMLIVALIRRSRFGMRALLMRESERTAIIAGVSVMRVKLSLFVISAAIAGVGGALLVHAQLVFSYESYVSTASLLLFVNAYIGGIGMVSGAVLAGIGAHGGLFSNMLASFGGTEFSEVIAGGILLVALQLHPDGMASLPHDLRRVLRGRRARREQASKASPDPSENVGRGAIGTAIAQELPRQTKGGLRDT